MVCASPRSIWAPDDPAAPKARRQNCSRAAAVLALLRIRSSAKSRSSGFGLSSSTSSPLTMAPTGLMRSWQTLEQSSAASSSLSGEDPGAGDADAGPEDDVPEDDAPEGEVLEGELPGDDVSDIRYSLKSAELGRIMPAF